ncbi:MAG: hypothetical protein GAK40_01303 [Burkholderia plantarii]|nr:MAG: hypothetical protein GAK40_01303 [Burkholderia plantarii]
MTWVVLACMMSAACTERSSPSPTPPAAGAPVLSVPIQRGNGIVLPVVIGGATYHFVFDTGASLTVIDNRVAAKITHVVAPDRVPEMFKAMLDGGMLIADGTRIKPEVTVWQPMPMALGSFTTSEVFPWLGMDLSRLTQVAGVRVDGILGIDVFRQLNWIVDNRAGTLSLWSRLNADQLMSHCVPYEDGLGGPPSVTMRIGQSWVNFAVDTGASTTVLDETLLKYMQQRHDVIRGTLPAASLTMGGTRVEPLYYVKGFSFYGKPVGRLEAATSAPGSTSLLGMNFWSRFDRYMFVPHAMQMCFEPGRIEADDPMPVRMLSVRFVNDRVELYLNSPAALKGFDLKNTDVLVEVNGKRVDPASLFDIRRQLTTTPEGQLELVVERDGVRHTVRM